MKKTVSSALDSFGDFLDGEFRQFPWENKESYSGWLSDHYEIISHTMRYLNLAAATSKNNDDYKYWMNHLRGEINHHLLLKQDARSIGKNLDEMKSSSFAFAVVNSVYGGMYRYGDHYLLGHALILERLACTTASYLSSVLKKHYGFNSKFLSEHNDADGGDDGHYAVGVKKVESLPLALQEQVIEGIKITANLYAKILQENAEGEKIKIAA